MAIPTNKEIRAKTSDGKPVSELELRVKLLEEKVEFLMFQLVLVQAMHRYTHDAACGTSPFGILINSYEETEDRMIGSYIELFGEPLPKCPWPKLDKLVKDRQEKLREQYEAMKGAGDGNVEKP